MNVAGSECVSIEIGGMSIALHTDDHAFGQLLRSRYAGFVRTESASHFEFDVQLCHPSTSDGPDDDVQVGRDGADWLLQRGDFHARWNPDAGRGFIRQTSNPFAVDSVLRIVHTLILARQGGFLLHAASTIRNGNAFLLSGVSGAGKTTISRLAPPDVTLLTDEVSYVRRNFKRYTAFGTPFAGELAKSGENLFAPIKCLFFLEKGSCNRIGPISAPDAVQRLLRNILFFAHDSELVEMVFQSACEFVSLVPVNRLIFTPDARVWEIIR